MAVVEPQDPPAADARPGEPVSGSEPDSHKGPQPAGEGPAVVAVEEEIAVKIEGPRGPLLLPPPPPP